MAWAPLLLLLALGSAMADPLTEAEAHFDALESYRATIHTLAADGERRLIRYYFRKPGWVRIETVSPHPGAVLIYDPQARRVRLWPFGTDRTLHLSLSPDSRLVRDARGHRVDRSDVGALLDNLRRLAARGRVEPLGETAGGGRPATGVEIVGEAGAAVSGVHRYRVWFAQDDPLPLRVESFAPNGSPIETVDMTDAETGIVFPDHFFTP